MVSTKEEFIGKHTLYGWRLTEERMRRILHAQDRFTSGPLSVAQWPDLQGSLDTAVSAMTIALCLAASSKEQVTFLHGNDEDVTDHMPVFAGGADYPSVQWTLADCVMEPAKLNRILEIHQNLSAIVGTDLLTMKLFVLALLAGGVRGSDGGRLQKEYESLIRRRKIHLLQQLGEDTEDSDKRAMLSLANGFIQIQELAQLATSYISKF